MPLTDDLCPLGFAPHSIRPTRCKRCFRDYNEHKKKTDDTTKLRKEGDSKSDTKKMGVTSKAQSSEDESKKDSEQSVESNGTYTVVRRRRERGYSTDDTEDSSKSRTRMRPHSVASIDETLTVDVPTTKPSSPKPGTSASGGEEDRHRRRSRVIQILSAKEITPDIGDNSDEVTSADVAFILQVKATPHYTEGDDDETVSIAQTDTTETTLTLGDTLEDLQSQIQSLKAQLEVSEIKYQKLEKEAKTWQENKYREVDKENLERTAGELLKLQSKVHELTTLNEDLKDENRVLKMETKELQDELDKRPSPEEVSQSVEEIRNKLIVAESLYEELMDENEDFKREIRDLEDEIEELQDNFREDQADEYGILKKELEQTAKNCRILQFKLRKSEKRCDQLDTDKTQYEDKLKELIKSGTLDTNQAEKLYQMEQELNSAREASSRMYAEMEALQNKLSKLQEEREVLSKKKAADGMSSPSPSPSPSPSSVPDVIVRVPSPVARRETRPEFLSRSKDVSLELDPAQLLRDLYDTMERENDLKEQLRFTEEEAENFRKKMSFLEQENETLALQIKKMATTAKRTTKDGKRPSSREGNYDDDSGISDDTDELTPSELKLQLELNEQETSVLRRKVEELEVENIALQKEVRELQERVEEKPAGIIELPSHPPKDPAQASLFYEQKVKILENEAKELRIKIIDRDRENERLSSELMFKQRKGSKTIMTRSRSLDSDVQIDLKRQLQLVEQEAAILRQKTIELENENDTLSAENKALQFKVNRRGGPLTPQEKLQGENLHLQTKIAKLEKLLSEAKDISVNSTVNSVSDSVSVDAMKAQLKQQQQEIDMLQTKVDILTKEKITLTSQLKAPVNQIAVEIKKRKKIPDLAPKQEFKKAVEELEMEVNQLSTVVKGKEEETKKIATDLEEKVKLVQKLQDDCKNNEEKFNSQLEELKKKNEKLTKSLDEEKNKVDIVNASLKELEKGKTNKLFSKDELTKCKEQIENLQRELKEEKSKMKDSRRQSGTSSPVSFEDLRKVEQEKHRLQKQIVDYQKQISDSDKRILELEQDNKTAEKIQRNLRHEIENLTYELDREKNNLKKVDNRQTEVAMGWLKEREEMKKQMTDLQKKYETLEKELEAKDKKIEEQSEKLLESEKKRDNIHTNLKQREDEVKHVKENNSKLKTKLKELEEKFFKVDKDMEELTEKWRKLDIQYKNEKADWQLKETEHESKLQTDSKKLDRLEKEHEIQLRDRDEEVIRLKDKLRKMDLELKSKAYKKEDGENSAVLEKKVKGLEAELSNEKQEYEDLTSKYEMLEEEHVVTKARLVMEKEQVENNLECANKDYEQLEGELKTLRETFNLRQDNWIKEKLDLQEKLKDLEEKRQKSGTANLEEELEKLNQLLKEKENTIEQQRKEDKQMREDVEKLKRQTQDLRSKLSDFERSRATGRYGIELSSSSQKELQELKHNLMQAEIEEIRTKLQQEEKVHRGETTALKMMNDVKIAQMQDELQMLHIQVGKFRRERDTYKEMLEGAQRTIGDLKSDSIRRRESYIGQETGELKDKVQNLRKMVDNLQEQLDQSERNNSHLKTEYITEKASWEIRMAEMQTKVNELEESTILQGGKSKIIGVKTKLELAWQKERDEQQRLLHESHRMAKELRQRVIDLENARDKERNEAKLQLEDLRKTVEADQAETQIKITELQSDLLELRDAHSKMRTTNDRIKRERDKTERERDEFKMRLTQSQQSLSDDITSINGLVGELERLKKMVPTILEDRPLTPTKTLKLQSDTAAFEKMKEEFKNVLNKVYRTTEDLRRAHGYREEERVKRNLSFRRALSATDSDLEPSKPPTAPLRIRKDDPLSRWQNPQRVTNYPAIPPSMVISPSRTSSALHRKSLSLDQSLTWEQLEQNIWKSESEAGSNTSLQESEQSRSQSSTGDYATLHVPQQGPSPLPRRRRRMQTSQTSLESSVTSSRDSSMEKDFKPPRPPSPNLDRKNYPASSSMTLPKAAKDKRPVSTGSVVKERFRMFGKAKSTEDAPTEGNEKPRDFKAKISNIFRKSPSRTSSTESEKGVTGSSVLTDKLKSLKPVSAFDPKHKMQYRSTGALHTKTATNVNQQCESTESSSLPYFTSSLSLRFLKKFHKRSKSMDDPASNLSKPKLQYQETEI